MDPAMLAAFVNQMYAESSGVYPESAGPAPEATPGTGTAQSMAGDEMAPGGMASEGMTSEGMAPQGMPSGGHAGPEGQATAAAEAAGAEADPRAGNPIPPASPPTTPGAPPAEAPYYFLSPEAASGQERAAMEQAPHPESLGPGAGLDPNLAAQLTQASLAAGLMLVPEGGQAMQGIPGLLEVPQMPAGAPPEAAPPGAPAGAPANMPANMPASGPASGPAQPPRFYFLPETESAADSEPAKPLETFHVQTIRKDFPILHQQVHGKPLIWMDNAATTQKPKAVIDAVSRFYQRDYSNIHRGAHTLAARATDAYENARKKVAGFLGAGSPDECVFVRGTTEAINLVANTWGKKFLTPGDEIVLTTLEHHANIVPWQFIAKETGAVIRVVPVTDRGEVMLEEYERLLGPRTRIAAFAHVSNALGTVLPVREMTEMAHRYDARVLVDGAQSVPHIRANVQEVGADFYVFSGHKLFAPSGVGVLYGKKELLELMPPWQGGGSMIRNVSFEHTEFEKPPAKFEAGTPTIADAVGLGAAIDYLERIGMENIARYEHVLVEYAAERLGEIPGLRLIGTAPGKVSVLSFLLEGSTPEEVGRYLDTQGIAVRAGHHCAQPTMHRFGTETMVRPSLAFYNTHEEVDELVDAVKRFPRH